MASPEVEGLLTVIERLSVSSARKTLVIEDMECEIKGLYTRLEATCKQRDIAEQRGMLLIASLEEKEHQIKELKSNVEFWKQRDLTRVSDSAWRKEEPDN